MRLIKQNMDKVAASEAMRGGALGALKYCTVGLFVGGILQAASPKFAAIRPPQKVCFAYYTFETEQEQLLMPLWFVNPLMAYFVGMAHVCRILGWIRKWFRHNVHQL